MSITKLTPQWGAPVVAGRAPHDLDHVRPYVRPPRILVGLLTGDGGEVELARRDREVEQRRGR